LTNKNKRKTRGALLTDRIEDEYLTILESVMQLAGTGLNENLLIFVNQAIELKPDLALAYIVKGAILQKLDEFEEAEKSYSKALDIEPDNPQALQAFGMLLVDQDRIEEAYPILLEHLSQEPGSSLSLDGLLTCLLYYQNEDHEKADVLFSKAWETTKRSEIGILYAHYLILQKDEIQGAKEILEELSVKSPSAEGLAELALVYSIDNECEKAIETLQTAVNLAPEYDRLWRGLAQCYNEIKNYEKAIKAADKALSIDPYHYRNLQAKAEVLMAQGDSSSLKEALSLIDQAKTHCQIDAHADPDAKPVLRRLYTLEGINLRHLGEYKEALKVYKQALTDFPGELEFVLYSFLLYYQTDQKDKAWDILPKEGGKEPVLWNSIAEIGADFFLAGQVEIALDIYERLVEQSHVPEILRNFGYILGSLGRTTEAIEVSKSVLTLDNLKEDTKIITCANLAYLYILQDEPVRAIEYVDEILLSSVKITEATLHIPFWFSGKVYPDPLAIPGRNITVLQAGQADYIAASLAMGDVSKAVPFLPVVQSWEDDDSHKYLVLAEINLAQGDVRTAKENLDKAAACSGSEQERDMIHSINEILTEK
jgi:tetratricopeptide (TPR) repeat protein